ncbi:MAG: serine/threonine protein kinase [Proteobacteria bacterium]|nr:serine/threonine protein kinase [Pseudomonadota bacterium]
MMENNLIGKELLGQFRIIERIGRGGMGEVYKAEQPAMDRLVAIKILHSKLASRPDLISRFRREARAMSRLSHPNTARVFLYGHLEDTQQLYIVMEFLDGTDLARLVRREGPMEVHRAVNVMIQMLGALEEAHSVGIVHRDLKPENILLTSQGGLSDFPKVLDFGLAKMKEVRPRPGSMVLTQEGMVFGTPEFMSPEQARGETLDSRSDIYSLSLIFYELVTGKLPFPDCKPMEYIAHHLYTEPTPITQKVKELQLPSELDAIIGKALEKNKEKRYQSAREFAETLKSLRPSMSSTVSRRALQSMPPTKDKFTTKMGKTTSRPPGMALGKPPAAAVEKRLLISLIVIILVLLVLVIWLLVSRDNKLSPTVVPISGETITAPDAPSRPNQPSTTSPSPP